MTSLAVFPRARAASSSVASLAVSPLRIREETRAEIDARDALLDAAMGPERFVKSSERLREGRAPARGLALVATLDGELAGTVRLWRVDAGGAPALMLGPLAVDERRRSLGVGGALIRAALRRARSRGHCAVILVGDAPYYERFGFSSAPTRDLVMPGPVDPARFLALELEPGALAGAAGRVTATGDMLAAPALRHAA